MLDNDERSGLGFRKLGHCLNKFEYCTIRKFSVRILDCTVIDNIPENIFSSQLIECISKLRLEQNNDREQEHIYQILTYPEDSVESEESRKTQKKRNNTNTSQQRPGTACLQPQEDMVNEICNYDYIQYVCPGYLRKIKPVKI